MKALMLTLPLFLVTSFSSILTAEETEVSQAVGESVTKSEKVETKEVTTDAVDSEEVRVRADKKRAMQGLALEGQEEFEDIEITKGTFFSYGYSKRSNSSHTGVLDYEVEYEDSVYQRVQYQQKYKKLMFGAAVDLGKKASDVISVMGLVGINNIIVSVEKSKISGNITLEVNVHTPFVDNEYTDIKLLYSMFGFAMNHSKDKQTRKFLLNQAPGASIGVQILKFERPSVMQKDGVVYLDPKSDVKFMGFVVEVDTVKRNLLYNIKMKRHDYYGYMTSAIGYGKLSLSEHTTNAAKMAAKPNDTEYNDFGSNMEIEVGYVNATQWGDNQAVLKIGYMIQYEGPNSMDPDLSLSTEEESEDILPTEDFFNHGINISFAMGF